MVANANGRGSACATRSCSFVTFACGRKGCDDATRGVPFVVPDLIEKVDSVRFGADKDKRSAKRANDEVTYVARVLEREGRLGLTRAFIQHGDVTVYAHVISVAHASVAAADTLERVGVRMDRASLVRGALLHDYFLYDWHDPDPSHRLHGFRHPFFALARAEEDFDLTPRERNIIVRHMFPLVPVPPTCREAWVVCLADKWCALRETVQGRLPRWAQGDLGYAGEADSAEDASDVVAPSGTAAVREAVDIAAAAGAIGDAGFVSAAGAALHAENVDSAYRALEEKHLSEKEAE